MNCEGSGILPYLQANQCELTCCISWTLAENKGPLVRIIRLYYSQHSDLRLPLVPLAIKFHGVLWSGPASMLKNRAQGTRSFTLGSKQTYLKFALLGDNTFFTLESKQTCSLLWKESVSLYSKGICYINIFEKWKSMLKMAIIVPFSYVVS